MKVVAFRANEFGEFDIKNWRKGNCGKCEKRNLKGASCLLANFRKSSA